MDRFIKFKIGNHPTLCAGCRGARPYGPRENPYWWCRVYDAQLGRGKPRRCAQCIEDEIGSGSDANLHGVPSEDGSSTTPNGECQAICIWCSGTGFVRQTQIMCRTCHGTGKPVACLD